MQYEIEVFNLKFMETWPLKFIVKNLYIPMLKLPSRDFIQNVFLMGDKIQVLNQFEFSKGFESV